VLHHSSLPAMHNIQKSVGWRRRPHGPVDIRASGLHQPPPPYQPPTRSSSRAYPLCVVYALLFYPIPSVQPSGPEGESGRSGCFNPPTWGATPRCKCTGAAPNYWPLGIGQPQAMHALVSTAPDFSPAETLATLFSRTEWQNTKATPHTGAELWRPT
jgi:hypothetical protein